MECVENCGQHADGPRLNFEQPVRVTLCDNGRDPTDLMHYRYGRPSSKLYLPAMFNSVG